MVPIYLLFLLFLSPQESTASVENMLEYCGYNHTCFGSEYDCGKYRNCTIALTAAPYSSAEGDGVEFELLARPLDGKVAKYVAVGLSFDSQIGSDSVVECVSEKTGPGLYSSFTIQNQAIREENVDYLTLQEFSRSNDILYCKFRRSEVTLIQGIKYDLSKSFHFQLGAGTTATDNGIGETDIFYDMTIASVPVDSGGYILN